MGSVAPFFNRNTAVYSIVRRIPARQGGSAVLRILIDSRMIYNTGIGRYIQSLILEGIQYSDQVTFIMAGKPDQIKPFCEANFVSDKICQIETVPFNSSLYSWGEQLKGGYQLVRCSEADVVHIPHFNGPWFLPDSSVITLHDLIPFLHIEHRNYFKLTAGKQVLRNVLRKAARVIVISEHTRADLIKMFPDLSLDHKVRLIYQGVSKKFVPSPDHEVEAFKKEYGLGRYILYVGNRSAHKNLGRLLKAYQLLQADFPEVQLVIAGGHQKGENEVGLLIRQMGLNGVREWERISDRTLLNLYSGAEVFVFPSLYEGFGLPPLEAMACGTAVVAAHTSSVPEVVGEAGIYVDPYDAESIAGGIAKLLGDSCLRDRLRQKGLKRAAMFTWENTFQQTLAVYEEVIADKKEHRQ